MHLGTNSFLSFFSETLLGLMRTKFEVFYTWLVMTLDKYQLYMLCYTTSNEFILVGFFLDTIQLDYIQYPMQLTIGAKVKSQPIS